MEELKPGSDPIQYIMKSPLGNALCLGFTALYKKKPEFPVHFLGQWLREYSNSQLKKKQIINSQQQKDKIYKAIIQQNHRLELQAQQNRKKKQQIFNKRQNQFVKEIAECEYVEDLLLDWLPQYLETTNKLAGCYVGLLTLRRKALEQNNFDPSSQFDNESPKIIEYIGSSKSQKKLMIGKILPSDAGKSYEVFNVVQEQQAPVDPDDGVKIQKPIKKKYLYIQNVLKDQKIYYFKYPQLGSYACFPLRIKKYLIENAFDKGVIDYKQYLKNKQEMEKQYNQKLNQLRNQAEQARKRADQFEVTQQQSTITQKASLQQAAQKIQQNYEQLSNNPPKVPQVTFQNSQKCYIIGCDTLGLDQIIPQSVLNSIQNKILLVKQYCQEKQKKMLLQDILYFIQDQTHLESLESQFRQFQKNNIDSMAATIKEQFPNSQKQAQYQFSVAKCQKLKSLLSQTPYQKSMKTYLQYSIPKYKDILQVAFMLVRYGKDKINLHFSNTLNWRKVRNIQFIEQFIQELDNYQLKRQSSEAVSSQYKINKLLERLQKIDLEQVVKYNIWIWLLANICKTICWTRIQCRDAQLQAYEKKVKAKEERQNQIIKYQEDINKTLQTHKTQLGEQGLQGFNEEQWRKNYSIQNPKPQGLQIEALKPHLDIQ